MVVKNTEFCSTNLFLKNAPKNSYTQKKHVFLRTFTVVFFYKNSFSGLSFLGKFFDNSFRSEISIKF